MTVRKGTKHENKGAVSVVLIRRVRQLLHQGKGVHQRPCDRGTEDMRTNRQVIRDGVLYHLQKTLIASGGTDLHLVQQLHYDVTGVIAVIPNMALNRLKVLGTRSLGFTSMRVFCEV